MELVAGDETKASLKARGLTFEMILEAIVAGYAIAFHPSPPRPGQMHLILEIGGDVHVAPCERRGNTWRLITAYGSSRAYRYNVEVSMTGKDGEWQQIVDMKQNAKPSEGAYVNEFAPVDAQFIRINMLGNTENDHNHLSEVRAYTAEQ